MNVKIEAGWKEVLKNEFKQAYFKQITEHIKAEMLTGQTIYPAAKDIFAAYNLTGFNNVKVVILGQDPYHNPNQAHGLSFSVPNGIYPPPSLNNIFLELNTNVGMPIPTHGNLTKWAQQGVLLLNASLTVRANEPMSHAKIGWATFTDATISAISNLKQNIVFLLWGKFAQEKAKLINADKHLILQAPHPSPLSAHKGFLGCQHFSQTNNFLLKTNQNAIDWYL
jgi:uracil-DNA glycosylase